MEKMEDKTKNTNTTMINSDITGGDAADRLSSLPEHLISDILSNLPTDSAAATSILSRHWTHQWTYITRFHLTSLNIPNCDQLFDFLTTVDNILRKLNSFPNLCTFYLRFRLPSSEVKYLDDDVYDNAYEICRDFLPLWFQRLCSSQTERFEVFEQRIFADGSYLHYLQVNIQNAAVVSTMSSVVVDTVSFPECIFQNKNLVELILTTRIWRKLMPNYFNFLNLNKLSLQIYEFDRQLMRTIFKSLPLLQDLTISAFLCSEGHFIDISAPSLKIFTIKFEGRDSQTNVIIDAPKLEHISISTWHDLVLFRFVKIPTHLLTTTLGYWSCVGEEPNDVAVLEIVKAIWCTKSLHLCYPILNVLNSCNVDEIPTFHNLVDFSLVLFDAASMNVAIPAWILGRVKTIKVSDVKGYEKEMSLMEYILSKANVLERLCVFVSDFVKEMKMDSLQKENDFIKVMFMLPRVSSSCEIEFNGHFVCASTNVDGNGSLTHQM